MEVPFTKEEWGIRPTATKKNNFPFGVAFKFATNGELKI
jgi:hypothetical protein